MIPCNKPVTISRMWKSGKISVTLTGFHDYKAWKVQSCQWLHWHERPLNWYYILSTFSSFFISFLIFLLRSFFPKSFFFFPFFLFPQFSLALKVPKALMWDPEWLRAFTTTELVMAELRQEEPSLSFFLHLHLYEAWRKFCSTGRMKIWEWQ